MESTRHIEPCRFPINLKSLAMTKAMDFGRTGKGSKTQKRKANLAKHRGVKVTA